jgi:hypothetical protein
VTSENKKKDMGESVNALRGFELERKFEDDRKQLSRLTKREREVYRLLAKSYKRSQARWALRSARPALAWRTFCTNWASHDALK